MATSKRVCPYNKCDGSGLIPLVKNGKVVPYAWLYCDCHPVYGLNPEPEHYHPVRPEDYDFPMSETFRAWTYEHCGIPDPGYVPPRADIADLEDRIGNLEAISAEPGQVPRRYHDQLQQLRAQVLYLQNKVNALLDKRSKREEKKTHSVLKGIET